MASIFVFWQMAKLLWMEMVFEESVVWALTIVVSLFCFTRGMGCLKAPGPVRLLKALKAMGRSSSRAQ